MERKLYYFLYITIGTFSLYCSDPNLTNSVSFVYYYNPYNAQNPIVVLSSSIQPVDTQPIYSSSWQRQIILAPGTNNFRFLVKKSRADQDDREKCWKFAQEFDALQLRQILEQKYFEGKEMHQLVEHMCLNFNRYDIHGHRLLRFDALKIILSFMQRDQRNYYNEQGQTIAHCIMPQADLELIQFLAQNNIDFALPTREPDKFVGSTSAHILAGIYNHREGEQKIFIKRCLDWVLLTFPKTKRMKCYGKTPLDLLSNEKRQNIDKLLQKKIGGGDGN